MRLLRRAAQIASLERPLSLAVSSKPPSPAGTALEKAVYWNESYVRRAAMQWRCRDGNERSSRTMASQSELCART